MLREHTKVEHDDVIVTKALRSFLWNPKIKLDITEIQCRRCQKNFDTFDEFLTHSAEKHDTKFSQEVTHCLFTFKLDKNDCHECGETFQSFSSLLKHSHKMHNKSRNFVCEICGESFVAKSNVKGHIKNMHEGGISCKICNKEFPTYRAYKSHKEHEHYKMKCTKCPEVLGSRYLWIKHIRELHDRSFYNFECQVCHRVYMSSGMLKNHVDNTHFGIKRFTCEICGYKSYTERSLKAHKVMHSDDRPFQCEYCNKTFRRKTGLEIHVRIHTNDKRCVCKVCEKAFVQTASLKLHMRVHHPEAYAAGNKERLQRNM